jgi:hypothetical protein
MGDLRLWTWVLFGAAWASVIALFGVGLSMETAKRISLRKLGRSIIRLSVGAAFATGAYATYFLFQR